MVGCASNPMAVSNQTTVTSLGDDKAQVVFMRDTFVGSAINASLYDVTNEEPVFIGIISNATKVSYATSPGKHTFMVVSEAADFMEADLSAGKTYYSLVTPRMGAWKARFSMWPIKSSSGAQYRTDSPEFKQWQANTKNAQLTEKAEAWFAANKSSIVAKQKKYEAAWNQKSAEDLAERTLNPEDGL
nr:hypothetical protein [Pseudomaricurvus sp. HS19]